MTHLVNLVAAVLLQVSLDVTQKGDVADTRGDQQEQRAGEYDNGEGGGDGEGSGKEVVTGKVLS